METEVGLFAMKREQVYRAMKPFQDVGVELDIIQLAPLSIYNFVAYDVLGEATATDEYDPENPPPSLVVLSMGTDTTDLVITNGFRVWQRSVPLGGNHFTKQLTKELKLTFAKAEHLKRNARQAEDPKLVFQAMRLVFNDLVTEVQRSIGYFQGIDRKAKIGGVVVLGNAVKLPGLQQYLGKNLGYEVNNFEAFSHLKGPAVLAAPAFKDNQLSFGVCYGLCLQGLGVAKLQTNLVPREIMTERLVRSKKPWAVASVAALLLACTFNVFFHYGRLHQVAEDRAVGRRGLETGVVQDGPGQRHEHALRTGGSRQLVGQLSRITAIGEELVGNADRRILWLEMLKTVNSALPQTPGVQPGEIPDVDKIPFHQRQEIHVEQLEVQYFEKLEDWFTDIIKNKYIDQQRSLGVGPRPLRRRDGSSSQTPARPTAGSRGPHGRWLGRAASVLPLLQPGSGQAGHFARQCHTRSRTSSSDRSSWRCRSTRSDRESWSVIRYRMPQGNVQYREPARDVDRPDCPTGSGDRCGNGGRLPADAAGRGKPDCGPRRRTGTRRLHHAGNGHRFSRGVSGLPDQPNLSRSQPELRNTGIGIPGGSAWARAGPGMMGGDGARDAGGPPQWRDTACRFAARRREAVGCRWQRRCAGERRWQQGQE